ncbi:unnamed protein product [Rodentolepis nana]|uniref:Atherin n=1 Tax=Rodentolepis nana TaxID=102285 RepID=A0A0R3TK31_RODNA|nr:unnamed protein product [Rodentolepis nana]
MLTSNGSAGPSGSGSGGGNTTTLLTVNGIIPNQQMAGQHGNRPSPVFTPFFSNATFTTFQSPFSGPTSVVPCIASPNGGTIFQGPGGQFPFNMTGSMLLTQPQSIINGTPISYQPFSHPVSVTNSSNGTTVVLATNDMCISSSGQLPIFQNGAVVSIASSNSAQTTNVSMNNNNSNNNTSNNVNCVADSTAPSIKCKPEVKPVVPLGTVTNSNSAPESNIGSLEKAQFYRDFILEAIDKLRDRKARPDMERISCLLRRQHNIQPSDTQLCLTRLAEDGSILCVDYKGNLSYRNPAKWRKTAASAVGIANKPAISKRLIEAVRSLIPEGGDKSQSFTLFQIEQAIKNQKPPQNSEGEGESSTSANTLPPELTGSGLKISLDKEVNYGGLAKLHDGRYVLDENGEKKHRSIIFNFNRRPFSGKLAANGTFGKPPIAPALDSVSGKPYNVFSLTPGRPLARRPPISTGKRGRPPSIKNKKMLTSCSQQPILPAPSDNMLEKRMKLEPVPVTPTQAATFVPIDGAMMVSATPMQTLSLTPAQQVTSQVSVSGGPSAAPTAAMMMYPGIYNHPTTTLFAVTPETTSLVGSTFQPADTAGATLPVTLNTSNAVVANSVAPTGSIVVVRPTSSLATTTVTTLAKEGQKPGVSITAIKPSPSEDSSQIPSPPKNEGICCRCQQKAGVDEFLICKDCGIKDESFGGEDLESCFERDGVVITSICKENKIGPNSEKEPKCVEKVSTFQGSQAVSLSLKLEVGSCQGQTGLKDSLSVMRSLSPSVQRPHAYVVQPPKPLTFKEWADNLDDFYSPESTPVEEYMWDSNFFGHSSVSQLTYTLVYLLGKILCIQSGVELLKLNIWDSLKFVQIRKAKKSVYDFDLFYSIPTGLNKILKQRTENKAFFIVLDHVLMCKDSGLLIKHSLKNNHQKCLVCYHALLLQKRNMLRRTKLTEKYFLSWTNCLPSAVFLPEPLNEVALDIIIRDIQVVLTSLKVHLLRSSCPIGANIWNMFIKGQRPKEFMHRPHPKAPGKPITDVDPYYLPLDLSVQRSAHPKCLDFSPETTATARQNSWQCANCKSCSVCKVRKPENAMLICDACDKGYHDTCHNPAVTDRKNVDQIAPWICSSCQDLGYHVKQDETKMERQEIDSTSPPSSSNPGVAPLHPTVGLTSVAVSKVDDTQTTVGGTKVVKSPSAEVAPLTGQIPEESHPDKSETKASPSKEASTNTIQSQEQMEVDEASPPNEDAPQHDISETQINNSRPENVRHWTANQVADWLREQGNYEREADIFRENEIDGCALMLLKNYNLLIDTKIKIGPAVKILEKVRILQASMDSRGL